MGKKLKNNVSCSTSKRPFESRFLAEEALLQHRSINTYADFEGPINVYNCDECGQWHFTSKGERSELLEDPEVLDRIKRERIANEWERKLRY